MAIFGDTLRQARAYKGVTLKEAEHATRINRHHLASLEDGQFASLPPLIYQRGIVKNYAAYLDLDASKMLAMFEEARGITSEPKRPVTVSVRPIDVPTHWAPNFAIIAFMVVMSAVVFAWLYSAYFADGETIAPPAKIISTVTAVPADELILPPTMTPVPPTATKVPPTSTPRPTATPEPTLAVEEAAPVESEETHSASTEADPGGAGSTEAPVIDEAGVAGIKITATSDIQLQIIADGNVVFDGWLGAGGSTDWFTAGEFDVYTSDGSSTLFTNDRGEEFYMGYGTDEVYQLFAS